MVAPSPPSDGGTRRMTQDDVLFGYRLQLGELVGIDCFFVGRLHGAKGPVWQITAIDTYSSYAWAELITTGPRGPTSPHTSALAHRVAADLQAAGWQLERVLTDNGGEFGRREFAAQ